MQKTVQAGDSDVLVVHVDVDDDGDGSDGGDYNYDDDDSFNKKLHIRKIISVNIIDLIMTIMMMMIMTLHSRRDEEAGDSTTSSTSTAATLPLPGMMLFKDHDDNCIPGVINIAYIGDGMSEPQKPGGTLRHTPWVEVKQCKNKICVLCKTMQKQFTL